MSLSNERVGDRDTALVCRNMNPQSQRSTHDGIFQSGESVGVSERRDDGHAVLQRIHTPSLRSKSETMINEVRQFRDIAFVAETLRRIHGPAMMTAILT